MLQRGSHISTNYRFPCVLSRRPLVLISSSSPLPRPSLQDDAFTESFISTIGVDFVRAGCLLQCRYIALPLFIHEEDSWRAIHLALSPLSPPASHRTPPTLASQRFRTVKIGDKTVKLQIVRSQRGAVAFRDVAAL